MHDDAATTDGAYQAAYDQVRLSPRARRATVALVAAAALLLGLAAPALASADDSAQPRQAKAKAHEGHGHRNAAEQPRPQGDAPAGTASISGHVTFPSGDPTPGYEGTVKVSDGSITRYGYASFPSGNYTVTGLPAGTYKVEFNRLSGYNVYAEAQFYNGHPEFQGSSSADAVSLTNGQARAGVDATLAKGGSISGKLVDGAGNPLSWCRVEAYTDTGVLVARHSESSFDGTFTIGGLTTGAYKVRIFGNRYSSCDGGTQYLTSNNGGPTTTDPAGAFGVSATRGLNHALASNVIYSIGGRITGQVMLPPDALYRDRLVVARNLANGAITRSALVSKADGSYTIRGLPTGSYRVTFARLSGTAMSQTEFFNNHPEGDGIGSADAVSVTQGSTRAAVNATLVKGGSISGHLVDGSGNDLAGCYVQAFTPDGSLVTRAAFTEPDGTFSVAVSPPAPTSCAWSSPRCTTRFRTARATGRRSTTTATLELGAGPAARSRSPWAPTTPWATSSTSWAAPSPGTSTCLWTLSAATASWWSASSTATGPSPPGSTTTATTR